MSPDTKLIASLVNRILVRLPSNSGKKLGALENDPLVNQTFFVWDEPVTALIELSKFRLPTITITLLNLLDTIKMPSNEEHFPIEHLQSQLFVLRLLSACMHPNQEPFEDALAKTIMNVMCRIMHQTTIMEEREYGQTTNHVTQITRTEYYTPTNMARTSADIVLDIYKASSKVVHFLSASNWNIVFTKIKARIMYLSTTSDENPETSDMRLLESCSLNSKRLATVLTELCNSFMHLKKATQLIVAAILRRAIWGWIETFPNEFIQLCQTQKKLEGGPDLLFEICIPLTDTTRKKAILWPLMTMLLVLCPDILCALDAPDASRSVNVKKVMFLNTLKSSLKGGRMAELATICYVDICKAATYVAKSDSPLGRLLPDIEAELRNQLFDPEKPLISDSLMSGLGIIIDHRTLLADCMVAMYRLNPRQALNKIFASCLDSRAPTLFKISLVKACLAIASEENKLPWNSSIVTLYDALAGPLRKLFVEFANKDIKEVVNRKLMLTDKRSKRDNLVRVDLNGERLELILDMLRLYQTDPKLAIRGDDEDRLEQNAMAMVAIANCLCEQDQYVRDAAAMCLFKLHSPDYILEWGPAPVFMETFWKIGSQILFALGKQLLDMREKDDSLKRLLDLLKRLFETRNEFLEKNQDSAVEGSDAKERLQCTIAMEIALLVLLCSSDIEICSAAIDCFGLICIEARLTDNFDHHSLLIAENLPIYSELSTNNGIVTGRKSQQKQIRRLLRMMTHYAPGNLAAWEEVYKRWKYMTPTMIRLEEVEIQQDPKRGGAAWHDKIRNPALSRQQAQPPNHHHQQQHQQHQQQHQHQQQMMMMDEDKFAEWQNYAGFLAALGGICLMADAGRQEPRRMSTPSESITMVNRFVVDMVDLLLCENIVVREWVKEILGMDLSPALYSMLFRYMETVLAKYFGPDGDPICNASNTLFVEQAISVLKLILDRMEGAFENLLTVDFSSLIDQYAKYLNKLGNGQSALKIKIKFCQLTEVLMIKKDKVTLRQEFRLRNKLLEIIVEWTSDFSLKPDLAQYSTSFESTQGEKLHRELDLACLNTIVGLLHQLPLQSPDPIHENDSTPVKSRIFFKYFTFFLKLLNRCRDSETDDATQRRLYLEHSKKSSVSTYLAPLKESTILAMSNLLSANVDAGLKHSLSMGYHDDPQMRTAFMKVLTNILNQGTEFETLAETVMTDRYEKVVDMLAGPDFHISLSLCDTCPSADIDDAANALLACFASRGKTLDLLKAVIQKEVQNTDTETELLRRTSIATRLLSVFAKQNGTDYVKSTLQPVFLKLAEKPAEEKTFELDPSKVSSNEDVSRNKQNVVSATEMFLNAICESANEAPRAFREVCHCILSSVRERYPEAKYTAVGAFIFLRFFCPAIVSPESEGLIKPSMIVSRDMKRGHLIATKVIQNLANNVLFGAKETYMIVLNDFLTSNIYKVTSFLREISDIPKETEDTPLEIRPMEQKDYTILHRVLFDNMERISRELATRRMRQYVDQDTAVQIKQQFDKFSNLMAQLGRSPEVAKSEFGLKSYTFAAANQLYADFMRRNTHRSVDSIVSKSIFYEGGVSKLNRPVFYYIARNVNADSIDFELLVYHILQTLERASSKSIEIVFDSTLFSSANEISTQFIIQFTQLLPFDVYDNITNFIIYNPSTELKKTVKRLPQPISHKLAKKFSFAVTLAEIYEYIIPNELRLPKSTTSLDTDQSHVFHPAGRVTQKVNVPVTIKVSAEYVQVMTVRKQEFLYNVTTISNDVYNISDIEDITLVPNTRTQEIVNEFHFKYKGKTQHIFTSMKRDAIVNHIRHNKRRLEMTKPNTMTERSIRPNDVPGRLLNMALLNVGSDDPNLRLTAYNLLYALSVTFHFDLNNQLLDAKDLCVPANSTAFVVNISEKIAKSQPNLTLEFLNECFIGFQKSNDPLRYLCLDYMMPWLANLAKFCQSNRMENDSEILKTKQVLRNLIDLTIARTDMYKLIQVKIWKTIGQVDDMLNLVLDSFIQFSIEHGIGSLQSEAMADTFVTLSNIAVRGKVMSRIRKVLQKTSFKPTRILTDHWTWNEIAVLLRLVLMLSFNNRGPVKSYVPETFHIVSLVVGAGPTLIRASVHGLVVNMAQSLCTSMPLTETNMKKLQLVLNEISDTKFRLLFGLFKPHVNAFTITPETLTDIAEPISLHALETIANTLLEVLQYSAPSPDMANAWRARWMSLVASTAFQFNPAIQPQAFVVLGCLGREEMDDDLLYQILVALRGALAIFNESDPNLVLSIMMCLKNIVESLPPDSRYLLSLFWVAVALVEINNGPIFPMAIELLLSVLRAIDTAGYFTGESIVEVLLAAREPMSHVAQQLDQLCGVNFDHFSFAVATIFLKGFRYNNGKEIIFQGLITFLDIECKHTDEINMIGSHQLGYLAGVLPLAVKNEKLKEILRLAGLLDSEAELDEDEDYTHGCIFEKLDITDQTTALLFVSTLVTQLQMADNVNQKAFIYGFLAEASSSIPTIFSTVYDTLLPKMNQAILNCTNQRLVESVKTILLAACSDPSFSDTSRKHNPSQKSLLDKAGFSALADPTFAATSTNVLQNAKLASEVIELIIA